MYKIVEKAIEAKKQGFDFLASVVKQYKYTTYYHVVKCDDVISEGHWIPASYTTFANGAHGRVGVTGKQVDWTKTCRK